MYIVYLYYNIDLRNILIINIFFTFEYKLYMFIKHESKYVKKINYRNWFMAYRIHIYEKRIITKWK